MGTKLTDRDLERLGLFAILRYSGTVDFVGAARALAEGGVLAMEITLNTPSALQGISAVRKECGEELRIGAGTILEPSDAEAAIDAGAEFIVTPTLQFDTISVCRERAVPIVCGALTPTEALAAHRAGAHFIKLFPADTLGPAYAKALLAPMPFLRLIPTGGVTVDNLAEWFRAGCAGVAVGSNLISRDILERHDWEGLTASARRFSDALARARH